MIWPEDCLGLVLAWTRARGSLMVLQLIFGMVHTNLKDYLLFAKRMIVMVLRDHPMAKLQIPSSKKIEEHKEMVQQCHPYVLDVWCTMDSLKLMIEQSSNAFDAQSLHDVSNMLLPGWNHSDWFLQYSWH